MALQILVVHEFGVTRKITHGYIMTEFSDAVTDVVDSPHDAARLLEEKKFDIVFCGLEMEFMDGFALYDHMRSTTQNRDTVFILMSATTDEVQRQRIARRGIEHFLPIPFTPLQLRRIIHETCDPRQARVHPRYIAPGAKALIQYPKQTILADVLNFSKKGMLCDFTYSKLPADFLLPCLVSIQFPAEYGSANAARITACLLRLTVDSRQDDHSPQKVRSAWKFIEIPETAQAALTEALEKARHELSANGSDKRLTAR